MIWNQLDRFSDFKMFSKVVFQIRLVSGSLKLTLKMDTDKDLSQAFGIRTTHELPPHEFKVDDMPAVVEFRGA